METLRAFLSTHAYVVIALTVLADQTGLPVPAAPFLLAAGALARSTGEPDLAILCALASVVSVVGHSFWYFAGRLRGTAMMKLVCRLSFEPEACLRRSQDLFTRFGPMTLIVARFIPGIDTMAQPLVGVAGMPVGQYLALTAAGAVVWSGVLLGLGYGFGEAAASQHLIHGFKITLILLGVALVGYAVWKVRRMRQLAALKLPRMDVQELKKRLDAGERLIIIDLRHPLEVRFHPVTIPGAKRFNRQEAATYIKSLPPGQGVVLFCNCPREAGSVKLAHTLTTEGGMQHVWPLEGGLDNWQKHNFPTQPV